MAMIKKQGSNVDISVCAQHIQHNTYVLEI